MSFSLAETVKKVLGEQIVKDTTLVFEGAVVDTEESWSLVHLGTILVRLLERGEEIKPYLLHLVGDDLELSVIVECPELGHSFTLDTDGEEMYPIDFVTIEVAEGIKANIHLVLIEAEE